MAADRMSWNDGSSRPNGGDGRSTSPKSHHTDENNKMVVDPTSPAQQSRGRGDQRQRAHSVSTVASLPRSTSPSPMKKRHTARSGSISENIVEANGVRKIVLETTSSSDSEDKALLAQTDGAQDHKDNTDTDTTQTGSQAGGNSKKNRKKRGKKKKNGNASGENQPLLGGRN